MSFQFVPDLPGREYQSVRSPNRRPRPEAQLLIDFAEALRARPMEWAVWPRKLTPGAAKVTTSRLREGFYRQLKPGGGFECAERDDQMYVRFNPSRVSDDRDLAFREGYAAGLKRGLFDLGGIIERAFQGARAELSEAKSRAASGGSQ